MCVASIFFGLSYQWARPAVVFFFLMQLPPNATPPKRAPFWPPDLQAHVHKELFKEANDCLMGPWRGAARRWGCWIWRHCLPPLSLQTPAIRLGVTPLSPFASSLSVNHGLVACRWLRCGGGRTRRRGAGRSGGGRGAHVARLFGRRATVPPQQTVCTAMCIYVCWNCGPCSGNGCGLRCFALSFVS